MLLCTIVHAQDTVIQGHKFHKQRDVGNVITRIPYDTLKKYKDSAVYMYLSTLCAQAESQVTCPIHFKVVLLPGVKRVCSSNMRCFGFKYSNHEALYIWVRYGNEVVTDNSEEILVDVMRLIQDKGNMDYDHNPELKGRITMPVRRGIFTFVLYNMTSKHYYKFRKYLERFTPLP